MRWLNADPLFVPHLANALEIVPTLSACQLSEFDDDVPIAGVLFDGYNNRSVHAHLWLNHAHRPDKRFYWAICDFAFNQLGVQNVVGTVPSSFKSAIRLNHHLGFNEVARIANYYHDGDDMILMVCTPESVFDFERLKPKIDAEITIAA